MVQFKKVKRWGGHAAGKRGKKNEEFEYWGNVCSKAMNIGRIVDYQVELAHGEVKK